MNKKLLGIMFGMFLILLVVPMISATNWHSNRKYSDNDIREVSFENFWGLGKEQGNMKLKSHNLNDKGEIQTREINSIGEQVVMYYEFNFNELVKDGLGKVEFKNMKTEEFEERDYNFVYLDGSIEKEKVCEEYESHNEFLERMKDKGKLDNKTDEEIEELLLEGDRKCIEYGFENVPKGEWKEYNSKDIPEGKIIIGIQLDVKRGEYYDGIWNIGSKRIDKHATWDVVQTLTDATDTVRSVNFNSDSSLLAVGSDDNNVYIYDTSDWSLQETLTDATDIVRSVNFNSDSSLLAVGSYDDNVYIYDTSDWSLSQTLTDATNTVRSVNFNSDSSLLAVGSHDNNVYIYDTSDWSLQETLTDATNTVHSINF